MTEGDAITRRKANHIILSTDGKSEVPAAGTALHQVCLQATALPELDFDTIDTSSTFLGKRLGLPIMIASMTGGTQNAGELNRRLARCAEHYQIPMGVGSQRAALQDTEHQNDFAIRDLAPNTVLFANLGAVQLVSGLGSDDCQRAVEMLQADALFLHLNAMQEAVQDGGDRNWTGVLKAIETVCRALSPLPVFAREVGFGLSQRDAQRLLDAGVSGLDAAGQGGTSWSLLEGRASADPAQQQLGQTFADWGLSTVESIQSVRAVDQEVPLIASGGIRSGLDVARCLVLGADVAALASPVMRAALGGDEALHALFAQLAQELRTAMFGTGSANLATLQRVPWRR